MNAAIARLKEWLAQLAPRERWMVLFCAVVVAVAVLYGGIWQPLVKAQSTRQTALEDARGVAARLEELSALAQSSSSSGAVNRSASLLTVVDQGARTTLGKQPTRIQPEGDKVVKVWVEEVSFDSLLQWMQELERRYGIRTQSAEIEKQATPGMVSAQLTLGR